jgi:hypothetical protein
MLKGLMVGVNRQERQSTKEDIMSIFGNIVSAIFGHGSAAKAATASPATASTTTASAATASPSQSAGAAAQAKPMTRAEVEAMIRKVADGQSEDLNWKESIVDLMKVLKLDSSLSARKELAQELGYKGQLNGSAEMNMWLHKQVMDKLAESGGVVPDSLKHS